MMTDVRLLDLTTPNTCQGLLFTVTPTLPDSREFSNGTISVKVRLFEELIKVSANKH